MKRTIAAVVVLALAAVAYRQYSASRPVKLYEAFAEEMLHRNYDAAAAMADGLTAADLARCGTQERIGAGPAMFQSLFPSRFRIVSREAAGDGVKLTAVQTVLFNPAGVESALRPAMYADLNQVIILRQTAGGWQVSSFENEFVKMDSLSGR